MKISLLTDHHISVNPRLWKEAFFFEKHGFDVTIITKWQSVELRRKDFELLEGHNIKYKCFLNLITSECNSVKRFYYRAVMKIASMVQQYFRISSSRAISHSPGLLYKKALQEDADLYSAHLECAFWAGRKLIRSGKKVNFDFEDWYSRDYLVPERPVKLLESLEQYALSNGLYCTAASQSMADMLKKTYQPKKEITVIYNGFEIDKTSDFVIEGNSSDCLKILWFSRNIGPHRGIEYFLKGLNLWKQPVELHLLGMLTEGYENELSSVFTGHAGHKIFYHDFMPHKKLNHFISQFHIGLAIEENINDNKELTISNKILQYLQCGLLVLASDTKGQKEVASFFPDSVKIVNIYDSAAISHTLQELFIKLPRQDKILQNKIYEEIFSWEAQEKKLEELINHKL